MQVDLGDWTHTLTDEYPPLDGGTLLVTGASLYLHISTYPLGGGHSFPTNECATEITPVSAWIMMTTCFHKSFYV